MSTRATQIRRRDPRLLRGLLGALVIIAIATVTFIAYRANSGLPLSSPYRLTVEVPDANRLIKTSDVRIAGLRVGQVQDIAAIPGRRPYARITLSLDNDTAGLPTDTRVAVREGAVLGATYVELTLGAATRTIPDGGTLPATQADTQVKLTDLLDMFDRRAADALQHAVTNLGDGLAGRGSALNVSLSQTAGLLGPLGNVSRALADPDARLARAIDAADQLFTALHPVAGSLAGSLRGGAATLTAVADRRGDLGRALDLAPGVQARAGRALDAAQPALDDTAALARQLAPSARRLRGTLHRANAMLDAGPRPLRALTGVAPRLTATLAALRTLVRKPTTARAIVKVHDAVVPLGQLLDVLAPAQTHCNAVSLWGEGWSSTFGALGSGDGPAFASLVFTTLGANGEVLQNKAPSGNAAINYLSRNDRQECEANNSPFDGHQVLGSPPGRQPASTRATTWDPAAAARARGAGLLDPPVTGR